MTELEQAVIDNLAYSIQQVAGDDIGGALHFAESAVKYLRAIIQDLEEGEDR